MDEMKTSAAGGQAPAQPEGYTSNFAAALYDMA